ncbi:hypothetical protein LSUE1_G005249 [Lachnellula suecica]|uniref:Uncharacterized protein n=1 Tax=Lachnellula suecica TaxID=602035 RepID=A0A8T9C5Z4_9HELO|nr:hypothetical protein LSUE1_G005249 [Lachnellula suecica]
MPSSDKSISSTTAHKGSTSKATSLPSKAPHKFSSQGSTSSDGVKPIDRYTTEEKDYRSHAVGEYDPYQNRAKERQEQHLKDVVEKQY